MHPQPLLRTLADPLLDHEGDDLHCAGNVYLAVGVACRPDFFSQFGAESVVFQSYNASTVDRTVEMPREASEQRIRQRLAAEESYRDAAAVILIHQDTDVCAALERLRTFHSPSAHRPTPFTP